MQPPTSFIGIDIASATFTSAVGQMRTKWQIVVRPRTFANTPAGFAHYLAWLHEHDLRPDNCVLCLEATGVYGEGLSQFLWQQGYRVAVEPPLKVKRAFQPVGHKSDPVDGAQIAEYAYRFGDELVAWAPREERWEQLRTLLSLREQLVGERTGHQNALRALQRKSVRVALAEQLHEKAIEELKNHLQAIAAELQRLIALVPAYAATVRLLESIPGVGFLLAVQLLVMLEAAPSGYTARSLAAYVGICPYEHTSGSSIRHPSTSRHYGPAGVRRLLFLAALSVRTHQPPFRAYFDQKVQEGKAKQLVINNIANKLLKIVVAVVKTQKAYDPHYRSVHPGLAKPALTKS